MIDRLKTLKKISDYIMKIESFISEFNFLKDNFGDDINKVIKEKQQDVSVKVNSEALPIPFSKDAPLLKFMTKDDVYDLKQRAEGIHKATMSMLEKIGFAGMNDRYTAVKATLDQKIISLENLLQEVQTCKAYLSSLNEKNEQLDINKNIIKNCENVVLSKAQIVLIPLREDIENIKNDISKIFSHIFFAQISTGKAGANYQEAINKLTYFEKIHKEAISYFNEKGELVKKTPTIQSEAFEAYTLLRDEVNSVITSYGNNCCSLVEQKPEKGQYQFDIDYVGIKNKLKDNYIKETKNFIGNQLNSKDYPLIKHCNLELQIKNHIADITREFCDNDLGTYFARKLEDMWHTVMDDNKVVSEYKYELHTIYCDNLKVDELNSNSIPIPNHADL